jgi:hypothetical protein
VDLHKSRLLMQPDLSWNGRVFSEAGHNRNREIVEPKQVGRVPMIAQPRN